MKSSTEENPFEEELIAKEWINSVENEKGLIRDKGIYPILKEWTKKIQPQTIVEIGSGQGICSEKIESPGSFYIGIEPSKFLTDRARELYSSKNKTFILGNAYSLPLEDIIADAVFSVNVWFHLENLLEASHEMARILKPDGQFLIITANPNENSLWEKFFISYSKEGKVLDGKVIVPINPLTRNIIYQHSLEEIAGALTRNGLIIEGTEMFGFLDDTKQDKKIFISIHGRKT